MRRRELSLVAAALLVTSAAAACGSGGDTTRSTPTSAVAPTTVAAATTEAPPPSEPPACAGPATARSSGSVVPLEPAPEPVLPTTFTDITGREVTVTDTSRILALDVYGTLATTVYALGFGDRLIGRDVSTGIPELLDLPLVTHNGHELNGEAILDLAPTLVITDYSIGPLEVQLQLIDSGIPVVILSDQRARAEIGPQIEAVATVLGVAEAGRQLAARVEADVQAVEARVGSVAPADPAQRLRMVFLYIRGTAGVYYWFGEGTGAHDLIEALGGVDVSAEAGLAGSRPITAEGLVSADPDLYLMMSLGLESAGGVTGLMDVPGVAETTAGQQSCVVDMSDYEMLSFGPQFPLTLAALATAIYGPAVEP